MISFKFSGSRIGCESESSANMTGKGGFWQSKIRWSGAIDFKAFLFTVE